MQTTKKPWTIRPETNYATPIIEGDGRPVCEVYGDGVEEREGNANLIAAAPELLDACQKLAPVLRVFAVSNGEAFPVDDCKRKRGLIPSEAQALIDGTLDLIAAVTKAKGSK